MAEPEETVSRAGTAAARAEAGGAAGFWATPAPGASRTFSTRPETGA